jgi:hypothetical protein
MSALVSDPEFNSGALQIWRWGMPQVILRSRSQVEIDDAVDSVLTADGSLLSLHDSRAPGGQLRLRKNSERNPTAIHFDSSPEMEREPSGVHAAGDQLFISFRSDDAITLTGLDRLVGEGRGVHLRLPGPARPPGNPPPLKEYPSPGVRLHARRLTVYDDGGRVVSVDLTGRGVGANLVVRP